MKNERFYNVLYIEGSSKAIQDIEERYIKQNKYSHYLFDIVSLAVQSSTTDDSKELAEELHNQLAIAYNNDVSDNLRIDAVNTVINAFTRISHNLIQHNVKPPELLERFFSIREQHADNKTMLLSKEQMDTLMTQLTTYDAKMIGYDIRHLYTDDYQYDNLRQQLPADYVPLSADEIEDEDQSYNITDNTLVVGIPTRYGVISDVAIELRNRYDVDVRLIFGNSIDRGELYYNEEGEWLLGTEPSLETVRTLLDDIGQLDNYAYKYGWEPHQIYNDESDEDYLANEPAFGVS